MPSDRTCPASSLISRTVEVVALEVGEVGLDVVQIVGDVPADVVEPSINSSSELTTPAIAGIPAIPVIAAAPIANSRTRRGKHQVDQETFAVM